MPTLSRKLRVSGHQIPRLRFEERSPTPLAECTAVETTEFQVLRRLRGGGSFTLSGETLGDGPPVLLLHGLSATRRNVVQGSRALVKRGFRLISYDARGHGASQPAPSYRYGDLVSDLDAVLDELELDRAALVGSSMGAATAMAFTLEHPERVPALVQITPAYTGYARTGDVDGESWERLATALEGGIEEFIRVAQPGNLPERWRDVAREATRQRMERHADLTAVAQALRDVPSSIAWKGLHALSELALPVLVIGSQDDSDWLHPLGVAEEYCRKLPNCELVVEEKGQSPLAWRGARLSNAIADFFERVGYAPEQRH
jgi:pimeloyl-ACP methyl ester carboxylesterase